MDNGDVAAVFQEMGDLLDIQGGDDFRARAFRRTATIIKNLREPVAQSLHFDRLHQVKGIGRGSTGRIKDIVRTGTCPEHQRLQRSLPPTLREMLEVKRIGPRVVRIVYRHLGVRSLLELEQAALTGRLARLPGLSSKGQADILLAIDMHRTKAPRQLLPEALSIGSAMVARLSEHDGVSAAVQCGSARRLLPTVGDLDLVAGSDDPEGTVQCFVSLPIVERVFMQGPGRATVRLASGQQMDLWTVPPSAYGAGIAGFTNSIRHNISLRLRAARQGQKVSEFGVFDLQSGRQKATSPTEEHLYRLLGLPLMAPEMREDTGEIEAAEKGALPTLIEAHDLRGDLQSHTALGAGSASLEEMAIAAKAAGREWIAVTDRWIVFKNQGMDRNAAASLREEERRAVEDRVGIGILLGVEVDIAEDGSLALPREVLQQFDWVTASVDDDPSPGQPADVTERLVRAVQSDVIDCLGHPRGRRLLVHEGYRIDLDRVAKAARQHQVALEVNGTPSRIDLDDVSIRHCRDLGVMLALSSDARQPSDFSNLRWACNAARRGWLGPRDVVNSLTYEDMRDRKREGAATIPRARSVRATAKTGPSTAATAILAGLSEGVSGAMRERLHAYVRLGVDVELEEALHALGDNALQVAFNLLMKSAGPQVLDD